MGQQVEEDKLDRVLALHKGADPYGAEVAADYNHTDLDASFLGEGATKMPNKMHSNTNMQNRANKNVRNEKKNDYSRQ